jgi:hypothetical protein
LILRLPAEVCMPYCAQCLIEYVEGTAQCEDCGAFLLPGSPPIPPRLDIADERDFKLVAVRIFTTGMGAELAHGILQSQGIPCALSGDVAGSVPLSLIGIRLLVREEDVAHAEGILKEYLDTEVPLPPEEPEPAKGA